MKPAIQQPELPAVQNEQPVSMVAVLQAAMANGITSANVDVVERLLAMQERTEQRQAEREFAADFHQLQKETPRIKAQRVIPDNNGDTRSVFASYQDIMDEVQPLLNRFNFSISFDTEMSQDGQRVTALCKLRHVSGHKEVTRFECRIGSGPPKASASQSDGSAVSFAKRYALCAALNIVIDVDYNNDASTLGDYITQEQAKELHDGVRQTNADEAKFLAWCKAESFEKIPQSMLKAAQDQIARRRKQQSEAR